MIKPQLILATVLLCGCSDSSRMPADNGNSNEPEVELSACAEPFPDTPSYTDNYHQVDVCGWTVQINRELYESALSGTVYSALKLDLAQIESVLPAHALASLKPVIIWLELDVPAFPGGVYHPSAQWLLDNGYPPQWAKGIQLGNAQNYLTWVEQQPAMVLHELAHAYDDLYFNNANPDLLAAFDNARNTGIYDSVEYVDGSQQSAYALTDSKEYFAELTEAYYWQNDFYPFIREELAVHDMQGLRAIELIWEQR